MLPSLALTFQLHHFGLALGDTYIKGYKSYLFVLEDLDWKAKVDRSRVHRAYSVEKYSRKMKSLV